MKNLKLLSMLLTVFASLGLFSLLQAKDEPPPIPDQDRIFGSIITRTEQKLSSGGEYEVNLTLSAMTEDNYPYTGLTKEDIKITDCDLPILNPEVIQVKDTEKAWAIVILLDISKSMLIGQKIDKAKEAIANYIDNIGSNDQVFIIAFYNEVKPVVGFSRNKTELKQALGKVEASEKNNKTKLYDAIAESAKRFDNIELENKAVVVVTDGHDVGSANSFLTCYWPHKEKRIRIYTIPIGKGADKDVLKAFSDATSGRTFPIDSPDELGNVFQRLLDRSTGEYKITYLIPVNTIYPNGSKEPLAEFQVGLSRVVTVTMTDRSGAVKTHDNSYSVKQLPKPPDHNGGDGGKPSWFLIAGIGILVLGVIIFLWRLIKHKDKHGGGPVPPRDPITGDEELPRAQEDEETTGGNELTFPVTPEPAPTPITPPITKPESTVQPWGFIEILESPDNPDMKGKLIKLTKPEMVIGKGAKGVDVTLPGLPAKDKPDHDESSISSIHCSIKLQNRVMIITDLESTNGVFISRKAEGDWERIESKKPVAIGLEDLIRLGRQKGYYVFRLRLPSDQIKVDETLMMNPLKEV